MRWKAGVRKEWSETDARLSLCFVTDQTRGSQFMQAQYHGGAEEAQDGKEPARAGANQEDGEHGAKASPDEQSGRRCFHQM
jgi:hypothetical protein